MKGGCNWCGDPACGWCFPKGRPTFRVQDLADVIAGWAYRRSEVKLSALAVEDVAMLIELAIEAIQEKGATWERDALDRALDSQLAGLVVDLVRADALGREIANRER